MLLHSAVGQTRRPRELQRLTPKSLGFKPRVLFDCRCPFNQQFLGCPVKKHTAHLPMGKNQGTLSPEENTGPVWGLAEC